MGIVTSKLMKVKGFAFPSREAEKLPLNLQDVPVPKTKLADPVEGTVEKLVELKMIIRVGEGYDYHPNFRQVIKNFLKHPPNAWTLMKLANNMADKAIPVILAYNKNMSSKSDFAQLLTVCMIFVHYIQHEKLPLDLNDKNIANYIYAMYWLDDKTPNLV